MNNSLDLTPIIDLVTTSNDNVIIKIKHPATRQRGISTSKIMHPQSPTYS